MRYLLAILYNFDNICYKAYLMACQGISVFIIAQARCLL